MSSTMLVLGYLVPLFLSLLLTHSAVKEWGRCLSSGNDVSWFTRCHPQLSIANWCGLKPTRAPASGDGLMLFMPCFVPLGNIGFLLAILLSTQLTPRKVAEPGYRPPFSL